MYDHNIFAVLTPHENRNKASSAFKLAHNARWFRPAVGGVAEQATISSRGPTPAVDAQEEGIEGTSGAVARLVLTFFELMQLDGLGEGIMAGTSTATSHILLGHRGTPGVSSRQYSIVIDDNMRIWLYDRYSTHRTAILAYDPSAQNPFGHITVVSGGPVIGIKFPNHQSKEAQYIENLRALIKKTRDEVPGVQGLGLVSPAATEPPSEAQTTSERLIYFKESEIGNGTFGRVFRLIRARDGKYLAGKVFTPPGTSKKRRRGEIDPAWLIGIRREYTLAKENPHPNIVQMIEMRESPDIMILMPYFKCGNIVQAEIYEEFKLVTAFGQILDCLTFLQTRGITHRDIKPDNVLVELAPHFKVMLSDFGLSKAVTETTWLETFCGTLKYMAPEVFPFSQQRYGPPADVWSLGVMALEWLYGNLAAPVAPNPAQKKVSRDQWHAWSQTWMDILANQLDDQEDGADVDLLQGMLVVDQTRRLSAYKCLEKGLRNGLFGRRTVDGLVACAQIPEEVADNLLAGEDAAPVPTLAGAEHDGSDATIIVT